VARDMLKIVRDQCDRLQETSPQIPDQIISEFKKKFGDSTPDLKKPEITNGLDPIFVYSVDSAAPLRRSVRLMNQNTTEPQPPIEQATSRPLTPKQLTPKQLTPKQLAPRRVSPSPTEHTVVPVANKDSAIIVPTAKRVSIFQSKSKPLETH